MSTKQDSQSGADFDKAGQNAIEGRSPATEAPDAGAAERPVAGSHADAALTNHDATPGTGALPSAAPHDEADAATG